jgi:hypothetical protein
MQAIEAYTGRKQRVDVRIQYIHCARMQLRRLPRQIRHGHERSSKRLLHRLDVQPRFSSNLKQVWAIGLNEIAKAN